MTQNFSSDKPISNENDDHFQRYPFAKRIADTIIHRESEDCIVIGIYGAWGEGKTSVLNFIDSELKANNIIPIHFNPWRYSDEDKIILNLLSKISTFLDKKLATDTERFGEALTTFGSFGALIGFDFSKIGEKIAQVDLEELKERVSKFLKEKKLKVVIFIDDIDRLDKNEIHAIFRLVKLTADFSNTTYILAFDDEMVSAAIGERFGEGNPSAGQNFLEKIIQVPLNIPVAQPEALQNFCFQLVQDALNSNNIKLTQEEARRYLNEFSSNILIMLNTPRLSVRYGNALSFSLPLLINEVNLVDLMLIEAIKIFYPNHYKFIKSNPEYFIGSYSLSPGTDTDKVTELKKHLELIEKNLTSKQKSCIQNLLKELFPRLNEAFHNYTSYDNKHLEFWFKNKRIVSPKYFNKYFTYTVIQGEISDIAFQNFLSEVASKTTEEVEESIKTLIEQSSPHNFLQKLRSIEEEINGQASIKIAKVISKVSHLFPRGGGLSFGFNYESANGQAAIFVYHLTKRQANKKEQFDLAKDLINEAQSFEFAYELNEWFKIGETPEETIFTDEQYEELTTLIIERALKEADSQPIFEKFPEHASHLFVLWAGQNKKAVTKYINTLLNKDPKKVVGLLRAFTPTGHSSDVIGPFKTNFTKDQYQFLVSIFDKNIINKKISKVYKDNEINAEKAQEIRMLQNTQSDINIVRQFRHWLKEDEDTITE